jgi:Na+/melibiose symporter-like transporter
VFLIGYFPIYQNIRKLYPSISIEAQTAYYVVFMCIVNIGWAAVQIGHMSLVPSLTYSLKRRVIDQVTQDRLNNKRNSFTFLSNLLILGMGIILFATMSNPTLEINILSYAAAGIGIPAGLFFIFGIDEVKLSNEASAKLSVAVGQNPQGDTYRKLNLSTDQIDESV